MKENTVAPASDVMAAQFLSVVQSVLRELTTFVTSVRRLPRLTHNCKEIVASKAEHLAVDIRHELITKERAVRQLVSFVSEELIQRRLRLASEIIAHEAANHIHDGDVVLTFSRSALVMRAMLTAHLGSDPVVPNSAPMPPKRFTVVIVDPTPGEEGCRSASLLGDHGISVQYFPYNGL